MPHIDHLAAWCTDIDRTADFYARWFGATAGPRYENPAKGFTSRFVVFDGGARLELMHTTTLAPTTSVAGAERMGLTHVAIAVGSPEAVDALTARMHDAGVAVVSAPRRTGDGYYESVVLDPDGTRVEITA